jgi:acetyltransferase-like isoleucine patch superfamily enzyme
VSTDDPGPAYEEVVYQQFSPSPRMRVALAVLAAAVTPLAWPLAVLTRRSGLLFRSASEALSLVPYAVGVVLRGQFYRYALRQCGRNLVVEFGAVFVYPEVSVGDNVLIGRYTIVHHCDIGDYALIGERCTFLSGSRQHRFTRTDLPMALQGGQRRRIGVGRDTWIGSHSVVMDDVGEGSVVAAASVVTAPVAPGSVVAGNPARLRRTRGADAPSPNGSAQVSADRPGESRP